MAQVKSCLVFDLYKGLNNHVYGKTLSRLRLACNASGRLQGQSAYCPRCNTRLYRGGRTRFSSELAIALTCLILFIPAHFFSTDHYSPVWGYDPATLPSGTLTLASNFPAVAVLILFCSTIAPLLVCLSVLGAQAGLKFRRFQLFRTSLWIVEHLKYWAMFDVFLVSLAISCFKVQDYADIYVGPGLYSLIILQVLMSLLITRISVNRYWEAWQPETEHKRNELKAHCHTCHLTQAHTDTCVRCASPLYLRMPHSIQKKRGHSLLLRRFSFSLQISSRSLFF